MTDSPTDSETKEEHQDDHKGLKEKYERLKGTTSSTTPSSTRSDSVFSSTSSLDSLGSDTSVTTSSDDSDHPSDALTEEHVSRLEGSPAQSGRSVSKLGLGLGHGKQSPGKVKRRIPGVVRRPAPDDIKNPDTLLVEDVPVSKQVAWRLLQRSRRKVDVASSGEEAVEKFKKHYKSLNLVLMDIMLPGISGVEATKEIRSFEKKKKIIIKRKKELLFLV